VSITTISPLRASEQTTAALVDDRRDVAINHRTVADRFEVRLFVHLRRATDVERTHGQLRARFTDRLRGDDADRFTDVDRRTTGQIATVALAADALRWLRRPAASGCAPPGSRPLRSRVTPVRRAGCLECDDDFTVLGFDDVFGQGTAKDAFASEAMVAPP
jgi:hypothetical protein